MTPLPRALVERLFTDGWESGTVTVLADWCEEVGLDGWAYRLRMDPKDLGTRWVTEVIGPMSWAVFPPQTTDQAQEKTK